MTERFLDKLEAEYWLRLMRKCRQGEDFYVREFAKRRDRALLRADYGDKAVALRGGLGFSMIRPFGPTMATQQIVTFKSQHPVEPKAKPNRSLYWLDVRPIIDI